MGTSRVSSVLDSLCDRTTIGVLKALFTQPREPLHLREIIRRVGKGQGAVQRVLDRLTEAGVLKVERKTRLKMYHPDERCLIHRELQQVVDKTLGYAPALKQALEPLRSGIRWAFVFGSMAAGRERPASDIDLAVVGDVKLDQILDRVRETENRTSRPVNVTLYSTREFVKKVREPRSFLSRVLGGPVSMIVGNEHELKKLVG